MFDLLLSDTAIGIIIGLGLPGLTLIAGVILTIIYFKYKGVDVKIEENKKKTEEVMSEIREHVAGCQKKGEEAASIRSEMQAQLQRIEGFLEGLFKNKK